jgi:hypothetical protein
MGRVFRFLFMEKLLPETHIKRQAARQDCLPSLLGYGDKLIEIVYGVEKKIFCTGPTSTAKAGEKSLVPA